MRALRISAAIVGVALTFACGGGTVHMGEACDGPDQCVDGGTCLNEVCSRYACRTDGDCENGLTCTGDAGSGVCALLCSGDEDCSGQQQCHMSGEAADGEPDEPDEPDEQSGTCL